MEVWKKRRLLYKEDSNQGVKVRTSKREATYEGGSNVKAGPENERMKRSR